VVATLRECQTTCEAFRRSLLLQFRLVLHSYSFTCFEHVFLSLFVCLFFNYFFRSIQPQSRLERGPVVKLITSPVKLLTS
jgi:hypothetical protein